MGIFSKLQSDKSNTGSGFSFDITIFCSKRVLNSFSVGFKSTSMATTSSCTDF